MKVWAVSKHMDTIRHRERPEKDRGAWEHYVYFDTEDEAKDFIINRAHRALEAANHTAKLAQIRLNKCERKFCR